MSRWHLLFPVSLILLAALVLVVLLALNQRLSLAASGLPPTRYPFQISAGTPTPTITPILTSTARKTPTRTPTRTQTPATPTDFCPQSTPEPLYVESVISPTNLQTQDVRIYSYRFDWIQIEYEAGKVYANGPFGGITVIKISLLPETTHHLKVTVQVKGYTVGHCVYPPYQLSTTVDKRGKPLVIHQTRKIYQQTVTAISPGFPSPTRTLYPTATPTRTPFPTLPGERTPMPWKTPEIR